MKKISIMQTNDNRIGVDILISDAINFKTSLLKNV